MQVTDATHRQFLFSNSDSIQMILTVYSNNLAFTLSSMSINFNLDVNVHPLLLKITFCDFFIFF